mgnify:CR=1 FL=1
MMRAYNVYAITELDFFGFELELLDECEEVIYTERFLRLDDAEEMGEKYLDGIDPSPFSYRESDYLEYA